MSKTLRKMESESQRKSLAESESLPTDVRQAILTRAVEAVSSGEPHKMTGGWVAMPYIGKHPAGGLLYLAWESVKQAQA